MINSQLDKLPRGDQLAIIAELIRRHSARLATLGTLVLEHDAQYPEHLK
jgi:hypothetical protein